MSGRRHLVLRADACTDELQDALLDAVEERVPGSAPVLTDHEYVSEGDEEWVWMDRGLEALLHLYCDAAAATVAVMVESVRADVADALADALEAGLPTIPLAELRADAERDPARLQRLGYGGGTTADPETVAVVQRALTASAAETRVHAAIAAGTLQWPELAEPLAAARERETDPALADVLAEAHAACARRSGGTA